MASSRRANLRPGVVTGDAAWSLLTHAKDHNYAIPAFNCSTSSSCNAVLEAAATIDRPIIIQFSEGDSAFFAGESLPNKSKEASVLGAVAGAHYVRMVAPMYGVTVLVHSDGSEKHQLPWFDGMLEADKAFFAAHGEPLFSSHALDLSTEVDNVAVCAEYLKKMAPMDLILEMDIGANAGEEDTWAVYEALSPISEKFTISMALRPEQLGRVQEGAARMLGGSSSSKPLFFVAYGGSGSEADEALSHGVVKVNVHTDDSRKSLREAEMSLAKRVGESCAELRNKN